MPELPEVETVRSALAPIVTGQQVTDVFVGRKDLRWPLPEALDSKLLGRHFATPTRRGKYVLMPMDDRQVLLIHLGRRRRLAHDLLPLRLLDLLQYRHCRRGSWSYSAGLRCFRARPHARH